MKSVALERLQAMGLPHVASVDQAHTRQGNQDRVLHALLDSLVCMLGRQRVQCVILVGIIQLTEQLHAPLHQMPCVRRV